MRMSDWISDVCSSDLKAGEESSGPIRGYVSCGCRRVRVEAYARGSGRSDPDKARVVAFIRLSQARPPANQGHYSARGAGSPAKSGGAGSVRDGASTAIRSEEHTSELPSLMRISYAVYCLKKKKNNKQK